MNIIKTVHQHLSAQVMYKKTQLTCPLHGFDVENATVTAMLNSTLALINESAVDYSEDVCTPKYFVFNSQVIVLTKWYALECLCPMNVPTMGESLECLCTCFKVNGPKKSETLECVCVLSGECPHKVGNNGVWVYVLSDEGPHKMGNIRVCVL